MLWARRGRLACGNRDVWAYELSQEQEEGFPRQNCYASRLVYLAYTFVSYRICDIVADLRG